MNNESASIIKRAHFEYGHRPSDLAFFWGTSKHTIDKILKGYEYQDEFYRAIEAECFDCPLEKCIYEISSDPDEKLKATCPAIQRKNS